MFQLYRGKAKLGGQRRGNEEWAPPAFKDIPLGGSGGAGVGHVRLPHKVIPWVGLSMKALNGAR